MLRPTRVLYVLLTGLLAAGAAGAGDAPPSPAETAKLVEKARELDTAKAAAVQEERELLAAALKKMKALRQALGERGSAVAQETQQAVARLEAADAELAKEHPPTHPQRKQIRTQLVELHRAQEDVLVHYMKFARSFTLPVNDKVSIDFVLIPAGKFQMGSPKAEKLRSRFEGPQHWVTLSKPFYMSTCEITQEQYRAVMESNPSQYVGAKLPVGKVTFDHAAAFGTKLSALTGMTTRLPTEAEWEYACRAGTATAYSFGDDEAKLADYAWYSRSASGGKPRPVGTKKPNSWGLHDMHGNVEEWVSDWYGSEYYEKSPATDPAGPATGSYHLHRGGGANSSGSYCRSAARGHSDGFDTRRGFRVVCHAR